MLEPPIVTPDESVRVPAFSAVRCMLDEPSFGGFAVEGFGAGVAAAGLFVRAPLAGVGTGVGVGVDDVFAGALATVSVGGSGWFSSSTAWATSNALPALP